MTLDECIARTKLPIRVSFEPEDGVWYVTTPKHFCQALTMREAKRDYFHCIKDLTRSEAA